MGIIPTRVGTSYIFCFAIYAYWDHPHACGDKCQTATKTEIYRGSSPRVWGQVYFQAAYRLSSRIIPTRVGTSDERHNDRYGIEDHPHACGDKTKEIKENSGFTKSTA